MPPATTLSGPDRWARDQLNRKRIELPYQPFPKQAAFHESSAKYRLFGGAAGPGKSLALLMEGVIQANQHDGANTLLLRRTFPELEKSLLLYFRRQVPRELYRSFNEAKHQVTWWNGSLTQFGYSRSEHDIYQYQGAEFSFIGVDELTQFTLGQWTFLTSRNRCPVPGTRPSMAGATNPGGVGHAWVKALWIDRRAAPGMESPDAYDPREYQYIPALISDNPVYARDQNYLRTLEALPTHLRLAFLEGDWNLFAGQYFDIFDLRLHTARAEELQLVPWLPRWISIDWGFEHHAAVYWHAQDGARTFTYREYVVQRQSPRALAQEIAERSRGEDISAVYLGPDAFAHRTDDASIADQLGDVFAQRGIPRPAPADNDRIGGWMLMYQLLESQQWIVTDNCHRLVELLPTLVRDDRNVEDVAKVAGDDPADAARYGLKSRLRPRTAPL
ncbi:MAG TPA: phage terminase large subunit, partial [Candidatus Acidoferrales bacterium]|nr:phage terminase large subunit [Candidatus Acidoferrales bacterium]